MCKIVVFYCRNCAQSPYVFDGWYPVMWLFSLLSQFPSTKLIMPIALSLCRHDNRAIHNKLIELITAWNLLRNDSLVCFFLLVSNYYYIYINHQYSNGARVTDT